MSSIHIQPGQYSFDIICPRCKERGVIVWENTGGERTLVSLTQEFYERISKKSPYSIELVCTNCDMIQRDTSYAFPKSEILEERAA